MANSANSAETATLQVEVGDTGPRLDADQCADLAKTARSWVRSKPAAVFIDVIGDAWDQSPVGAVDHDTVAARFQAVVQAVLDVPCPVVVAVDGRVSGVGLALILAADVQFTTERSTLAIGDGGPVAGLLGGASWLISRLCGAGTFGQLAWLGGSLTAPEAVSRGLVTTLGAADAARTRAEELARDSAGWSALKRALRSRERNQFDVALRYQAWLADVAGEAIA